MRDPALWREVGQLLQRERRRRRWTLRDVMRRGGPNYATVQAHERGRVRTTTALTAHLTVFRWRLFDVMQLIANTHPIVASSDVLAVFTSYEETTDAGKAALHTMAALLPPSPRHTRRRSGPGTADGPTNSGEMPRLAGVRRD
jgi:hypothetical protein